MTRLDGTSPTNPFHLSRAYAASRVTPGASSSVVGRVAGNTPAASIAPAKGTQGSVTPAMNTNVRRLVAGTVPGKVDFSASEPRPSAPLSSIPMYRHPADKNAAATAINAGRTLDLNA